MLIILEYLLAGIMSYMTPFHEIGAVTTMADAEMFYL